MRDDELSELGVVKTATPCSANWDEMQGDDVKRFCAKCRLHVWNFSELTTDEARRLLVESDGRLCGRIFTREDGTVLTKDCPTGVTQRRRRRTGAIAAAAALLAGAATATVTLALAPEETCDAAPKVIKSANERGSMMTGKKVFSVPPSDR